MEALSAAMRGELLAFLQQTQALQFGAFTLRSGRVSPYFFNSARFQTGAQLARLGEFFAAAIARHAPQASIVFGPAYKGIPLCVTAAMAFSAAHGRDLGYLFNRKEAKAHGDRGRFVGREPGPEDRLVLVDDVITDGGTKREAVALLRDAFNVPIDALVIAFNRREADADGVEAAQRFQDSTGIPVVPLLTVDDLETALQAQLPGATAGGSSGALAGVDAAATLEAIRAYRLRYGVRDGMGGGSPRGAGPEDAR